MFEPALAPLHVVAVGTVLARRLTGVIIGALVPVNALHSVCLVVAIPFDHAECTVARSVAITAWTCAERVERTNGKRVHTGMLTKALPTATVIAVFAGRGGGVVSTRVECDTREGTL